MEAGNLFEDPVTIYQSKVLKIKFLKQLRSYLSLSVWMPVHARIIINNYLHSSYIIPFNYINITRTIY